jgi:hypothetical protein
LSNVVAWIMARRVYTARDGDPGRLALISIVRLRDRPPGRTTSFLRTERRPLADIERWLGPFRQFWDHKLDALATEVARGKKQSKS